MGLIDVFMNIIDPFKIYRKYILKPFFDLFFTLLSHYGNKTKNGMTSARGIILRTAITVFCAAIIIWTAIFMYIAFYYAYMPSVAHMRPVHMQFQACELTGAPCSFPSAHVSLTKKQQLLMVGQPYKVYLHIDMPESPENQNIGMFMVCAEMRDQKTTLRGHSCRAAMLHYKSPLLHKISTWLTVPLLMLGVKEETQRIPVELFSNYEDDSTHPVTDVYVEIQSKQIQFYSVTLHITAHFTGLRYIMFHWPVLSAFLGVSTNLFFILIICLLSWYHWADKTWIDDAKGKIKDLKGTIKNRLDLSGDGRNALMDDEDLSVMEEKSKSDSEIDDIMSDGEGVRRRSGKSN